VAILTRKPWVRRRRRLFGWKVRFMMSGPLSRRKTHGETQIVANRRQKCQLRGPAPAADGC
jgi:hypothetical protein